MSYQAGKLSGAKKTRPSYLYSVISITLVLFMLGTLGCFVTYGHSILRYLRENIELSLYLKDSAKDADIAQLQKKLGKEDYVKSMLYISKDSAMQIMENDFHGDVKLLDNNPLPASIVLYLKAEYVNQDSLAGIEQQLLKLPQVSDVEYVRGIVQVVNKNIRNVAVVFGSLLLLLFLIALSLIDNTIKLAMYSSRFIIRSMQLVGATRWFIIKPFVTRSIINGMIAGVLAVASLAGILYYVQQHTANLLAQQDQIFFLFIFIGVIIVGIFMSLASTYFAVSKYLGMKLDDLY